ncbi:MAG: hypothetical protein LC729_03525 [Acidobacteria bacterium]|nr:hypothetical protein [Acidobacteriota bacterium]
MSLEERYDALDEIIEAAHFALEGFIASVRRILPHPKWCYSSSSTSLRSAFWLTESLA